MRSRSALGREAVVAGGCLRSAAAGTWPLYSDQGIQVPVMRVHGRGGRCVDFEHNRRKLRVLAMAGNTPVGLEHEDEGHGIEDQDHRVEMREEVAGILRMQLREGASGVACIRHTPPDPDFAHRAAAHGSRAAAEADCQR